MAVCHDGASASARAPVAAAHHVAASVPPERVRPTAARDGQASHWPRLPAVGSLVRFQAGRGRHVHRHRRHVTLQPYVDVDLKGRQSRCSHGVQPYADAGVVHRYAFVMS